MPTQQRNFNLDSLRGIMLVIITINHTSGPFHKYTFQTFGFISAAEGFIFLSGIMLGLINGRRLLRYSTDVVKNAVLNRSRTIYVYHLFTIFAITVPWMLSEFIRNNWQIPSLTPFFQHPFESFTYYALLLNQPALLDILPMYVLFILLGYWILLGFYHNKERIVLICSFTLWLFSQFNWTELLHLSTSSNPFINLGYFNPFSWQFLFTVGCYLGYCSATGKTVVPSTPKLTRLALIICCTFLYLRYTNTHSLFLFEIVKSNTDRSILGISRLINFAAFAYLLRLSIENWPKLRSVWLETLGQHSLQTFTFHIVMVYYLSPFVETISNLGSHYEVMVQLLFIAALTIPAFLHKYLQKRFPSLKLIGL